MRPKEIRQRPAEIRLQVRVSVLDTSGGLSREPVEIDVEAFDVDSDAQVALFYDTDDAGFDGVLIVDGLVESDGRLGYTWDTEGVAAGEYFIYARAMDENNPPVYAYADAPVTVSDADPPPVADLTGNGFVDFEDLTVLLAAWNQNVSATEGNLVDADGTPVNFEDLTVLLAAWTGPGPAAAPVGRRLAAAIPVGDIDGRDIRMGRRDAEVETSSVADSRQRRGKPAAYAPLRRLQAAAVDGALADYQADESPRRDMRFARRTRRGR